MQATFQQPCSKSHQSSPSSPSNNPSTQTNSNNQRPQYSRKPNSICVRDFQNEERRIKEQLQQLKSQVIGFHEAQTQFLGSPIAQNDFVYLVSLNWLSKWKQLVHFNEIINNQILQLTQLPKFDQLGVMNTQLVDRNGICTLQLHDHGNQYLNECLKKGLVSGKEYKFISMKAWSFLKVYRSIPILRKVHKDSGTVEVYLLHAHLFIISHRIIRQLRQHKRKSIPFQTVQISKYGSSAIFSFNLKHIINTLLETKYQVTQKYGHHEQYDVRFIQSTSSQYSLDKIRLRVQNSYLSQCKSDTFTVRVPEIIQHLDENPIDLPRQTESIIVICELFKPKTRKTYEQPRIVYTKEISSICPKCKKMGRLNKICFCQHIVYCSSNCQMTDVQHLKVCLYRKKRIKKEVNKVLLKNNNNLIGLYNQQNDCYMNASIQCIYRIHELTDYLIHQGYLEDMIHQLPKQSLDIFSSFTSLFTNLNKSEKKYVSGTQFKRTFQKKYPHFSGNNQHDAVQFLQELLAFLFESLGQKTKNIKQLKDSEEKNYKVLSQQAWNLFNKQNNSQLAHLFGGQQRNTYKCPICCYESNGFSIFNPVFLCIPSEKWKMFILHNHKGSTIQKIKLFYKKDQNINRMIQKLRQDEHISPSSQLLVYSSSTELSVTKQKTVQEINRIFKEDIHVRVLSKMEETNGYRVLVKLTQDLGIGKIKFPQFNKMFKFSKDKSLYEMLNHIYECYRDLFNVGSFIQEAKKSANNRNIRIMTEPSEESPCQVCRQECSGCEVPFSQLKINRFFSKQFYCYKFVYLIRTQKTIIPEMQEKIDRSLSLTDCLRYQYMENLVDVKCSKCLSNIQVYQKTYLMRTPQILILSIKRITEEFKKNEELVRFPVQNLNMLPFCDLSISRSNSMEQSECFDLFAVCSHTGSSQNGHYTATCKVLTNQNEWKWYRFNDERVHEVKNINDIINGEAYILFYRKK